MNKFSKIIKSFANSSQEVNFNYIFRDYYYVIRSVKITEVVNFEKLCFNISYEITLADRK